MKGFIASAFDLGPHAGHMAMLEEALEHCNYLTVALHVNPQLERPHKNKPIPSLVERQMVLKGCKFVSEVICYETEEDLLKLLHLIKPDIRFLGADYEGQTYTGMELKIETHHICRKHGISSSKIREQVLTASKEKENAT